MRRATCIGLYAIVVSLCVQSDANAFFRRNRCQPMPCCPQPATYYATPCCPQPTMYCPTPCCVEPPKKNCVCKCQKDGSVHTVWHNSSYTCDNGEVLKCDDGNCSSSNGYPCQVGWLPNPCSCCIAPACVCQCPGGSTHTIWNGGTYTCPDGSVMKCVYPNCYYVNQGAGWRPLHCGRP